MNKKVRNRRPASGKELAKTASAPKISQLEKRARKLGQEIHVLECSIAAAPRVIRQHRLDTMDTLPPVERTRPALRRSKRLPLQQQRNITRRRWGLLAELALVVTALAAALGWLNQWFHFWG